MVSFITTFFTSIFAGFNFTSDWDRDRDPLDAKYFCRLGNRNGVIQSNTIEVQDIDSYRTGTLKNDENSVPVLLIKHRFHQTLAIFLQLLARAPLLRLFLWSL